MPNMYKSMDVDKLLEVAVGHIVGNTDIPKDLYIRLKKLGVTRYLPEDKILETERAYSKGATARRKNGQRNKPNRPATKISRLSKF